MPTPQLTSAEVRALVEAQIATIRDEALLTRIRELLVPPHAVVRAWDYGTPDEAFTCWTVLEHPGSNTGIGYCPQGFGPQYPWGLVFLSGPNMSLGMDSGWFRSLEDAMRESMAWEGPPIPGYEVP